MHVFGIGRQWAPLLGLDVSESGIKLVELGRDAMGRLILERCGSEPLKQGWVIDGNIEKFDEVTEALRRVVHKSGTSARNAALALPPSAVITKKIVVPAVLSEQALELQVAFEAQQYIPFPLEEVSLDFCVVGEGTHSEDMDVLITACRKEKVQDRQGLAEAAGLRAVILDVTSYASRRAASRLLQPSSGQEQAFVAALFELGAATTMMQVMRDQELLYERDLVFGDLQLTESIMRHYGWLAEEAEARKRSGDLPPDYEAAVRQPVEAGMAKDIARALQFFFTSTSYQRVDRILLAGGCACMPGLSDAVTRQTGFPCAAADPFEGMEKADGIHEAKVRREATSYLTACGLAMRRFTQ